MKNRGRPPKIIKPTNNCVAVGVDGRLSVGGINDGATIYVEITNKKLKQTIARLYKLQSWI